MFNLADSASPKSPAGLYFLSLRRPGRSRSLHCSDRQSLSWAFAVPCVSRKSRVKQGGFQGVNPPPVFITLKQEREQVKIWDTAGVPKPKSYLDLILSLQSKVFKSAAPFNLPTSLLPSTADR